MSVSQHVSAGDIQAESGLPEIAARALAQYPQAAMLTDLDGRILFVNGNFSVLTGYEASECLGKTPRFLLCSRTSRQQIEDLWTTLLAGQVWRGELINRRKDGTLYWESNFIQPVRDDAGEIRHFLAIKEDVSESRLTRHWEQTRRVMLEMLAGGASLAEVLDAIVRSFEQANPGAICSVLLLDPTGRFLQHGAAPSLPDFYNQAVDGIAIGPGVGCCGTAAFTRERVIVEDTLHHAYWDPYVEIAKQAGIRSGWSEPILSGDGKTVLGTFAIYHAEPMLPLPEELELIQGGAHLARLAIEHHRTLNDVHTLANFDSLTGLPNRRLMAERCAQALALEAQSGAESALILIDLDQFKTINDSLGHRFGDQLLCAVAHRLEATLRDCDTLGRLGGDEFVLLLPGHDRLAAARTAQRLISTLGNAFEIEGSSVTVTPSIGISMVPVDAEDFETLLKQADAAMYRAKAVGRNNFQFFTADMNAAATRRLELENEMRKAALRGDFYLVYQPQFDLATGALVAVEALMRWTHARLGEIPPGRFIPAAEDCGLIHQLGAFALHEACRQARAWQDAGMAPVAVSVNVSARQFAESANIVQLVRNTLRETRLDPRWLEIEITESVFNQDLGKTRGLLRGLQALGVRCAVDDFGTGYSSLAYLKELDLHRLKIDQSFVSGLAQGKRDRAIAAAIVNLGHGLDLAVIAEGVETEEQKRILIELGCDQIQGYLCGRPMEPDRILAGALPSQGDAPIG